MHFQVSKSRAFIVSKPLLILQGVEKNFLGRLEKQKGITSNKGR